MVTGAPCVYPQVQLATYLCEVPKLRMSGVKPLFPYTPSVSVHMYTINLRFHLYEGIRTDTKGRYTLSVKLSDFNVWRHTWRKNWVNCAVFTGNSTGLRTVLSSPLSLRELSSSLTEYHSFLSLLSNIVTRTRRHTELTRKVSNLMGNLCCAREHSVQFFMWFIYTVKLHSFT
jgi:hypothetical protein